MPKARKAAPNKPDVNQPFAAELTHERLLAQAERARWDASGTTDETLRRQLLDMTRNYDAMAKTFETVARQRSAL
jgi:hypothetical protein